MSASHPPAVPIEVDAETGVWRTDGLAMLYLPRHFFINNHAAVEQALGRAAYAELLYEAGRRSAYQWCEQQAATHALGGIDVFQLYLRRLSERGWGQFDGSRIDPESRLGTVRVRHSCFVEHAGPAVGKRCYMFAGWPAGALEWVGRDLGLDDIERRAEEVQCAADGDPVCVFAVRPADS